LISVLADTGYNLKGFYARHNETADSYSIKNIKSHKEIMLMTRTGPPEVKPGHFQINESGIQAGTRWLEPDENDDTSILVLDEIGYYELNGMVWHELFSNAVNSPKPLIFTTKTRYLSEIISKWRIHPAAVFYPLEFLSSEKIAKQIIQTIKLYERDSF
jgi:nucleoside-triphosphatase THEP1